MGRGLFRPFTTATDPKTVSAKLRRRRDLARAKRRVFELRQKVQAREPLSDADHRLLAKMGPRTLLAIGYTPRVTLETVDAFTMRQLRELEQGLVTR